MNSELKKRINKLPGDAPSCALIAAWANLSSHDLKLAWMPQGHSFDYQIVFEDLSDGETRYTQSWMYRDNPYWKRVPELPRDERIVRLWLQDGAAEIWQNKRNTVPVGYVVKFDFYPEELKLSGIGDSPEDALCAVVDKFAHWLRSEAATNETER